MKNVKACFFTRKKSQQSDCQQCRQNYASRQLRSQIGWISWHMFGINHWPSCLEVRPLAPDSQVHCEFGGCNTQMPRLELSCWPPLWGKSISWWWGFHFSDYVLRIENQASVSVWGKHVFIVVLHLHANTLTKWNHLGLPSSCYSLKKDFLCVNISFVRPNGRSRQIEFCRCVSNVPCLVCSPMRFPRLLLQASASLQFCPPVLFAICAKLCFGKLLSPPQLKQVVVLIFSVNWRTKEPIFCPAKSSKQSRMLLYNSMAE